MLNSESLHPRYGAKLTNLSIAEILEGHHFEELRRLFEQHSLLLFRGQTISDDEHLRLGALFGPKEDRTIDQSDPDPEVSLVSNKKTDGELLREGEQRLLELQSNMLWHADSTFLPVPALANILIGRVIPPSGTSTEFASTRAAWVDMPESLKARARDVFFIHDYAHSRRQVDASLAQQMKFTHWGQQVWRSVWTNPVNGKEALYIASHICGAVGMTESDAQDLARELIAWCTREEYVYTHQWQKNDVLIWDERAVLHRGVPWNYAEERTLSSICISAQVTDGLDEMRLSK
ncbi:MAG: TauD/TfdA family dioxygenase [Acidiferrobacterales bacterium]|nr:TauD/TfdA family dioxygenase [Acidiferrobacterales bacterium]